MRVLVSYHAIRISISINLNYYNSNSAVVYQVKLTNLILAVPVHT